MISAIVAEEKKQLAPPIRYHLKTRTKKVEQLTLVLLKLSMAFWMAVRKPALAPLRPLMRLMKWALLKLPTMKLLLPGEGKYWITLE